MKSLITILFLCGLASPAFAHETALEKINVDTSRPAVQRGAETLMDNCHSCHSLKYINYKDLLGLGVDKAKVAAWQGDLPATSPLTGQLSDEIALQSFGKVPPDLSLMISAREGRGNYMYSYLMGYFTTPDGTLSNHVFPETKMPDVLAVSGATEPAQRAELQNKAKDIVSFLSWTADPHEAERITLGYYVLAYLVVLTVLMYLLKKQIWARLEKSKN